MKTAKLIIGIVSIVLTFLVLFQSCAAGLATGLEGTSDTDLSGSAGLLLSLFMVVAGIVAIVGHKSEGKGCDIAAVICYALAWLIGIMNAGVFKDLQIWAWLCFIFAIVFAVSLVMKVCASK